MSGVSAKHEQPPAYCGPERRVASKPAIGWLGPARRASDALAMPSFAHLTQPDRSVIAFQRRRLAYLSASHSDAIPDAASARQALGDDGLVLLARAFARGTRLRNANNGQATATITPHIPLSEMVQRGTHLDSELHDGYFGVVRTNRPDVFVRAVVACVANLRAECRAGSLQFNDQDMTSLASGLRLAFILAADCDPGAPRLPRVHHRKITPAAAARRWLRGHQIFLVLTQAMLVALAGLDETSPEPARLQAIERLTALMVASSAALQLTGDFAAEIYDDVIRPTMAPPFMPDGFSGLFSSDHRMLVSRLRDLRPLLDFGDGKLAQARRELVASFAAVYDSHIAVCSRFVGADRKSLLMNDKASCNAIEQLTKFKNSRLRLVQEK